MNARSSERINGMMVLLRGYVTMASELAGDQWNEGDVSCSVVRRVVIPDCFYTIDGLLHTFMTILNEFGIYEENIGKELAEHLPFLATSAILTELVKKGMGREIAHEVIKKHATTATASNFFKSLSTEKNFPLSIEQLNELIKDPALFAGGAIDQSRQIIDEIKKITKGQVIKVDLQPLI
jgi:adenylosuccinate lyase